MAGLYIHIPFCKQACYYCDFHFSTNQQLQEQLIDALCQEILMQRDYLNGEPLKTIYFGGGTPSLLSEKQLDRLVTTIHREFDVTSTPEITLEANPDDLSDSKLHTLSALGINRLSIGIQSFDDTVLHFLNRAHNREEAINSIVNARKHGITNISIDLIYAIPNRSKELWIKDLEQAYDLHPTHLSSYCLTIEPGTVFGNWKSKGKLWETNDESAADQFDMMIEKFDQWGYEQYEVSNFCQPGHESIHNSNYWRQEKYLGIGPSAHSYDRQNRQFNVSHNKKYLDSIKKGIVPFTLESLSPTDKINDYILTTLRTKWGTNLNKLKTEFGYDVYQEQRNYINMLIDCDNATLNDGYLMLTKSGLLLADQISSDLFI